MKILVTGSNGFLGRELVKQLKKQNHIVVGLDKDRDSLSNKFIQQNLLESVKTREDSFDVCIHLASSVGGFIHNASREGLEENELRLLKNVLKLTQQAGCNRILYASSINVFEQTDGFYETSLESLQQKTPYARAKALGEKFIEKYFDSFGIVRMTNLFGWSQLKLSKEIGHSHVIPELLRKIDEDEELEVLGDGNQERNFLHVSDAARFFTLVLQQPQRGWFNLRSDLQLSIKELSESLLRWRQRQLPIRFRPEYLKYEPNPIGRFESAATKAVGWKPKINSLVGGLEKFS